MTKFEKSFRAAHTISTPLVSVRTFDSKSTIDHIKSFVDDTIALIAWDCITGLSPVNESAKHKLQTAMNEAGSQKELTLQLSESLRVASVIGEDAILFVKNAHLFWSDPTTIQGCWNLRDSYKAWGSMLVLLTGNGAILPAELSNDFLVLDEPLPNHEDLKQILLTTFEYAKLPVPSDGVVTESIAALSGLPAFTAEQAISMSLDPITKSLDMSGLWDRKRQAINQTRGLTVLETDSNVDNIGGLEQFKLYLERIMTGKNAPNVILLWDEIEKSFAGMGSDTSGTTTKMGGNVLSWSQDTAMLGCIAVGVPGAGKTEIVKAIANKYGKLCIAFNLADMESGIVGSSNEYLRNAQAMIDSISDKKVLSIATSNNIQSLSAEIQRRFATEGIFFFDAPTEIERASIWDVYRVKFGIPAADPTPNDNGWTGAEIKNCASKAYRLGITLAQAADYIVPVTKSNAARIDALRRECSGKYLSASDAGVYHYNESLEASTGPETAIPATGRKMRG
jgi:SpoVK/Ycf46/Vps4 family AAA+-type ATPase